LAKGIGMLGQLFLSSIIVKGKGSSGDQRQKKMTILKD